MIKQMDELYSIETSFYNNAQVWAFRISNVEDLDLAKTFQGFSELGYDKIIVSEETSTKGVLHHHGLLAWYPEKHNMIRWDVHSDKDITYSSLPISSAHEDIVKTIKFIYPDAKGNKCIYCRQSIDKAQLLKYTLKEGLFFQKGFSSEYISSALLLSTSKEGMKKSFSNNVDKYLLKAQSLLEFMSNHIQLKVKHKQPLYNNHLEAYFRSIAIRGGDLTSVDYAQTFYERLNIE